MTMTNMSLEKFWAGINILTKRILLLKIYVEISLN